MRGRHWTDGLSADAIRAEMVEQDREGAARANWDRWEFVDWPDWALLEFPEWFPGSLKRVDTYIEGERR